MSNYHSAPYEPGAVKALELQADCPELLEQLIYATWQCGNGSSAGKLQQPHVGKLRMRLLYVSELY